MKFKEKTQFPIIFVDENDEHDKYHVFIYTLNNYEKLKQPKYKIITNDSEILENTQYWIIQNHDVNSPEISRVTENSDHGEYM